MEITFKEKTKIVVYKNGIAFGSITKTSSGKEYRFKAHQGNDCPKISSENLEDLKVAIQEKIK
jgi:hypothetical protein